MPATLKNLREDARCWPFTIRITREERRLLQLAAIREQTSRADVIRLTLDPLFRRLQKEQHASS